MRRIIQRLCFGASRLIHCSASARPSDERVTFFACAKKGNQRNTPQVTRSPGILPSESAIAFRGSSNVHPCTCDEARASCARPFGPFLLVLVAPLGVLFGGFLSLLLCLVRCFCVFV